jgi:hypothetical protein
MDRRNNSDKKVDVKSIKEIKKEKYQTYTYGALLKEKKLCFRVSSKTPYNILIDKNTRLWKVNL